MSSPEYSDHIQPWQTLGTEQVADCRIFTLNRVTRRSERSGVRGEFYYIGTSDWVNVVAVTDDDRLVLIRQYRHGSDEITLEIPGGIVDPGERPEDAARRELLEETGFECDEIEEIGRVRPNPAIMNNWTYTLLARGVRSSGRQNLDEHEEIDVDLVPLDSLDELLRSGAITHSLVIGAFLWYKLRQTRDASVGHATI